jgi:hypothetical protein
VATRAMKFLLRLYPPAWRRRYGREMSDLVEQLPSGAGVAMDLLIGAAAAYASAIRDNRILSSAASYLHGVCVAVLVQAIAFVTLILFSQQSHGPLTVWVGPFPFVSVAPAVYWGGRLQSLMATLQPVFVSLPALALLLPMVVALVLLVVGPGWVRRRLA